AAAASCRTGLLLARRTRSTSAGHRPAHAFVRGVGADRDPARLAPNGSRHGSAGIPAGGLVVALALAGVAAPSRRVVAGGRIRVVVVIAPHRTATGERGPDVQLVTLRLVGPTEHARHLACRRLRPVRKRSRAVVEE